MSDWTTTLNKAKAIVAASPLYKKWIDGTPLQNDIAAWMAEFALEQARAAQSPLDVREALELLERVEGKQIGHWVREAPGWPNGTYVTWNDGEYWIKKAAELLRKALSSSSGGEHEDGVTVNVKKWGHPISIHGDFPLVYSKDEEQSAPPLPAEKEKPRE